MDTAISTSTLSSRNASSTSKYNLLYVDDEEANLRIFKYSFSREYNVFLALTGEEALEVIKSQQIHLIVTDQRMPKMTGVDLLKLVVPKQPTIVRMILTGFSDVGALVEAVNAVGIHKYIQKPWDRNHLKSIFEEELERAYGNVETEPSVEGEENESSELRENVEFIQQSILKEDEALSELFGETVLLKHNPRGISSDIYWVGRDKAGNKVIVFLDSHLKGVIAGMISVGLYNIVGDIILKHNQVSPEDLLDEIREEYINRYYDTNVRKYTDQRLNICVVVVYEDRLSFRSNYSAVKAFNHDGKFVLEDQFKGEVSIREVSKLFVHSNGVVRAKLGDQSLEDLLIDAADLDFKNYIKFISSQVRRLSGDEGIDDLTIIGINLEKENMASTPVPSVSSDDQL